MKFSQEDYDTLHDGLDALAKDSEGIVDDKERDEEHKRIKEAGEALDTIGTY